MTPTSLLLAATASGTATAADPVPAVRAAHNTDAYYTHEAVKAQIHVRFRGVDLIQGTVWFDAPVGHARIETTDGTTIVFDGSTCWVSPADAQIAGPPARFHILTWPYFIAAMHKLDDPGTHRVDAGEQPLTADRRLPATKLSFDSGVGDAPDDWYYIFADPESHRLEALAYIVTFGKELAVAEEKKSIVFYGGYVDVEGVPFATQYDFYYWDEATGRSAESKGSMTLSDISFVAPAPHLFERPDGARVDTLPK